MNNKVIFVCPLYNMRNHFQYAIELLISMKELQITEKICFIFSNEMQKNDFTKMARNNNCNQYEAIILPLEWDQFSAKAVVKKFYGLYHFMNSYEFIVLIDCETQFIKKCDFYKLCNYIWDNRTMLNSNKSIDGFDIMRTCYKTMGVYNNKSLRKELDNYKYNFWFNDLQVYKSEYLPDFFKWLKKLPVEKIFNESKCFEYYVFFAYLFLEHNFHIRKFDYESAGGINEYLDMFEIKKQKRILNDMDFHWTSSKELCDEKIVMRFHLDRDNNCKDYGYILMRSQLQRMKIKLYRKLLLMFHL